MALDEATQAELDELIATLRDDALSTEQGERLAAILRGDRDARLEYLRRVDQCASIRRYSADLSFTHDPAEAGATSMLTEALMRQRLGADEIEEIEKLPEAIVSEKGTGDRWGTGPEFDRYYRSVKHALVAGFIVMLAMLSVFFVRNPEVFDATDAAVVSSIDGVAWPDQMEPLIMGDSVDDHEIRLDAGELELTFDSGAVVRLVGPCAFTVDDRMGGELAHGRLAAHVPDDAHGFTITGRGFAVIDRGTAFNLDVPKDGKPWVHVTEGAVDLALTNTDGSVRRSMRLTEDLSALVDHDARQITVAEPVAIAVHSTGVGLGTTEPDPHWRVTSRKTDGTATTEFTPGPAYAADYDHAWIERTADHRARWITVLPGNPPMAGSSVHTFATRFDLTGLDPDTAKLTLRFIVDNQIDEMRVNGLAVDVPEHHNDAPFKTFYEMILRHVFLDGVNTIEFDVRNILPPDQPSPTGLLVELRGSAHRIKQIDIHSGDDR